MVTPIQRITVNTRATHEQTVAAAVAASTGRFLGDLATGRDPARSWDDWRADGRTVRVIGHDGIGGDVFAHTNIPEFTITRSLPLLDLPTGGNHEAPGAAYDVHLTTAMTTSQAVSMAVRAVWIHLDMRLFEAPEAALDWYRRGCPVNVVQSRRAGVSTRGGGVR
ncbi:hypothetical protein GCG21_08680 [Pseudactinotalea sp. HY160]|uniref:hypothetical protein n=1 Tax=Pseudactinotalea sp. HY160 TaxID=2654490 RepID=UPI00128D9ED4|nr:hypothetical protein [Pseudactinotalea sp. HY160]MPV50079.1 hypothetical protein [Pseudactinotalea sp. HY160]